MSTFVIRSGTTLSYVSFVCRSYPLQILSGYQLSCEVFFIFICIFQENIKIISENRPLSLLWHASPSPEFSMYNPILHQFYRCFLWCVWICYLFFHEQECTGSICLAYGLESCQCIPGPRDSNIKACELCCKIPGDDQPCLWVCTIPAYNFSSHFAFINCQVILFY